MLSPSHTQTRAAFTNGPALSNSTATQKCSEKPNLIAPSINCSLHPGGFELLNGLYIKIPESKQSVANSRYLQKFCSNCIEIIHQGWRNYYSDCTKYGINLKELWSLYVSSYTQKSYPFTSQAEQKLRVFEKKALRTISGPKWKYCYNPRRNALFFVVVETRAS